MKNPRFMLFEERKERTIVRVNVYAPTEARTYTQVHTSSRELCMTDHEWHLFKAQLDTNGVDYEVMNSNVIVITKITENKKDK